MSQYAYKAYDPDGQEMDGPDGYQERWEDDVPDGWWATEVFEDQYDRAKPDWDERYAHG